MRKVLFVNPSCRDQRVTDQDAGIVPIGLYYLAALLIDNGYDARILNLAQLDPAKPDEALTRFVSFIRKEKPDVIGFSVTNPSRHQAMNCAAQAKKHLPGTTILFGGPAPTFMPDFLLQACPDIDFIIRGEGETTCLAVIRALFASKKSSVLERARQIPGLVFKDSGSITDTGQPKEIRDLDTLVHPSKYFTYQHLAMSRGCSGNCTFCGSPKFWGRAGVRFHSARWFAREILALAQKGVSHFFISDDTFTMDKPRVIDFCRRIADSGATITWNAISRVDTIDMELLTWMRKAGCIQISYGVESGSDRIKKALGKPISNDAAVKAFSLTTSAGIMPRAYFIYGSPGETRDTIQESIDLLMQLQPLGAVFYMLVLFPGTHLYQHARQKHLVSDQVWHRPIEDLPWFELDDRLDFNQVKAFGDALRTAFFTRLEHFTKQIHLADNPELFPFHADFLSRLALTFSHGDYSRDPRVRHADQTARDLFQKALDYHPHHRGFLGLSMVLQKQKKFQDALVVLENGLTHYPEDKDLSTAMGITLMNLAQFRKALGCFRPFDQDPAVQNYINICRKKISG